MDGKQTFIRRQSMTKLPNRCVLSLYSVQSTHSLVKSAFLSLVSHAEANIAAPNLLIRELDLQDILK
jgi:hypothetical protein